LALVSAGAVSRVAGLAPLLLLEPARKDGAAASAGAPSRRALLFAGATAVAFAFAPAWTQVGPLRPLIGLALAAAAAWGVARLSGRQIGGYTGDVAGAAQQTAEIAFLSALCLGL
jgi:adenosylcobinamide-GDP ribazoletransferase